MQLKPRTCLLFLKRGQDHFLNTSSVTSFLKWPAQRQTCVALIHCGKILFFITIGIGVLDMNALHKFRGKKTNIIVKSKFYILKQSLQICQKT